MPRTNRFAPPGHVFHVGNRGNDRRTLFHKSNEYAEFIRLLTVGKRRYPVKVFGLCLMPNHFHAMVQPDAEGALSTYLQWVEGRYAADLRARQRTTGQGHVFEKRFWSDGIDGRRHFLSVLRYIEANPVRCGMVRRATDWPWSSIVLRQCEDDGLLDPLPHTLPSTWENFVNSEQPYDEIERIRRRDLGGRRPPPLPPGEVVPDDDGDPYASVTTGVA